MITEDLRAAASRLSEDPHLDAFLQHHTRFQKTYAGARKRDALGCLRTIAADIQKEASSIIHQYKGEGREPTGAENDRLDQLQRVLSDCNTAIDGKVSEYDRERNLAARSSRLSLPRAGSRLMSDLFAGQLDTGGFKDLHDFLGVFRGGRHDDRLQAATNYERDGYGSGYLVPSQFFANLLDASLENEIVRPRADVVPMTSNEAFAPAWDTQDHSSGSIGGLHGEWLAQLETADTQAAKFRAIQLVAKKLGIFVEASNELVEDATMFGTKLETAMRDAITWHLDYAFLRGTGAGQPLGVLNDPSLVTVAKETGQAADTIVHMNLAKMFARLHPASIPKSVWVANSTCIPQMLTIFATDGGTGQQYQPALKEDGSGGFTLLTRPVFFSEKLPLLGDTGDIVLCDFSQYVVGLRREAAIERSQHVGWARDAENFRVKIRADGKGKWSKPFTPKNGHTQSWCVALGERA